MATAEGESGDHFSDFRSFREQIGEDLALFDPKATGEKNTHGIDHSTWYSLAREQDSREYFRELLSTEMKALGYGKWRHLELSGLSPPELHRISALSFEGISPAWLSTFIQPSGFTC